MAYDSQVDHQHKSLDKNVQQIRLLTLEPSASWTSPIHCRLTHYNLDPTLPRFEALSYTWEGGLSTISIFLDGQRQLVTPNLEAFLRHRREAHHPVILWVDAICINQEDNEEKNSQVKLMNLIYLTAERVMVWLGRAEDDSDLAMKELLYLGTGSPYDKIHILTGPTLTAIQKLLNRGWWYRIWIIQEIFWGGGGTKLGNMRIRCGHKELWWTTLVIAAARMQSHKDDQRQYFPGIDNIFTLENLRHHAGDIVKVEADENLVFDLVSQHRHFQSTDPRDKIFALLGVVVGQHRRAFSKIKIDYSASVQEIYKDFAIICLQSNVGLKVLNQCHIHSDDMLPTWVPDWSVWSTELPLPSSKEGKHNLEPWWTRPIPVKDASANKEDERITYRYEFPLTSKTSMQDQGQFLKPKYLPGGWTLNPSATRLKGQSIPKEIVESMQELMKAGKLIVVTKDDDGEFDEMEVEQVNAGKALSIEELAAEELKVIKKGERITKHRVQSKIAASTIRAAVRGYRASGDTRSTTILDEVSNTFTVEGFLWDTIDILQAPFAIEVAANWENATHFMVAIGQGKQFAIQDYAGPDPYSTTGGRTEAFWLTLLGGQTSVPDWNGQPINIRHEMRFQEWLPLIPSDWIAGKPPVTVTSTGRLDSAQSSLGLVSNTQELQEARGIGSDGEFKFELPGPAMDPSTLQPTEWTNEDRAQYTAKFQDLAQQWKTQPYDLYQRPFTLPNVVPDPYWETRKLESRFCNKNNPVRKHLTNTKHFGFNNIGVNQGKWYEKGLGDMVPFIPRNTLPPGFEKYALGRSLAMTKKGYLGLVSKGAQKGDRVAVLMGSETPFILRKRSDGGFAVIGETYMHGIMDGEVIEAWTNGRIESGKIVLH